MSYTTPPVRKASRFTYRKALATRIGILLALGLLLRNPVAENALQNLCVPAVLAAGAAIVDVFHAAWHNPTLGTIEMAAVYGLSACIATVMSMVYYSYQLLVLLIVEIRNTMAVAVLAGLESTGQITH